MRGTNDHLVIGIGGARQAVIAAAALRCLGGELQAQFWPVSRSEIAQAREYGYEDMDKVLTNEELAPNDAIVAATGVSTATLPAGCDTSPTAPARSPSSCARAATGALRRRNPLLRAGAPRGRQAARVAMADSPTTRGAAISARRPVPLVRAKVSDRLNDVTRRFVERSPFLCLATAARRNL